MLLHFCNNFINCRSILKIFSLLDTAINYLQNEYNISRHFWKTSLHYRVKHKTLKSAFALSILDDKAVNSTNKIFKHSNKHITLLAYLLSWPATRVPITSPQSWGTVGHLARLQQSAVDSAIDGERVLAPVYGPKRDILSSDSMVIEWAVIEAVKQCSKFVECVF